jgi:isoleucyl-tRNA synthetase
MFPQFSDLNYSQLEREILDFWKREEIFRQSIESRPASHTWTFYEGPPTVNGVPGIHHVISRALKDVFCRYKTMQGYRVYRKAGWDTHGLPVEIALEKQLGLKEKGEIETKVGVAEFNRLAKALVDSHINAEGGWRELTEKMGYWLDLEHPYVTCSNDYIESVWWALSQSFKKGLIYRGFKIVPQCPHCETPLSSHELAQGYKDVRDPSLYVKARIVSGASTYDGRAIPEGASFLVWTTTPWTLISNVALAVGPAVEYVLVRTADGELFILAEARLAALDVDGAWEVLDRYRGADLVGVRYERLFDFVAIAPEEEPRVVTGDFVSTEDGTGIVHIAPAFGADDYDVYRREKTLPFLQPVTSGGRFTAEVTPWAGRPVKTIRFEDRVEEGVDKEIVIDLKTRGLVLRSSNDYLHSYPHCWRCDNPLIYYARDSWFIRTTEYAHRMIEENRNIRWQPEEIGSGRFGNWLEENKDWSLSRDRYWGTPLPIWVNEDDRADMFVVGSVAELMEGVYVGADGGETPVRDMVDRIDLHKPFVDAIVFRRDGRTYRRTPELIDVWFDSGAMPFAQWHYPFENREAFHQQFPADYICEAIDQTRGWFYTLHAISTQLFESPASRSILVNGHILDRNGQKMSKRLGNMVDPFAVMERYGADAVRWYLVTNSPVSKSILFNEDDIPRTVIAQFFRALTNTYSFFAGYANIDGFTYAEERIAVSERTELDRWILSELNATIASYHEHMGQLDPTRAMRGVSDFAVEQLSNWYVRRNRRRFWKGEMSQDKLAAYQTLYECLLAVAKLMAPLAPFLSEHLYRALNETTGRDEAPSVHIARIPEVEHDAIDEALQRRMSRAQSIVALARMLREKSKLKVRQPLRRILIPISSADEQSDVRAVEEIIKDELNVKAVEYVDAAESDSVVRRRAKPNFKAIGPRFGKTAKAAAAAIGAMTSAQITALQRSGSLTLTAGNDSFDVFPEDVEVVHEDIAGWLVASEGAITVALDTELDDELISEGLAREFVNRVQTLRKDSGLDVTDRIRLVYDTAVELASALESQREYVMSETLAVELVGGTADAMSEVEINGITCRIAAVRAEAVSAG